MTYVLILGFWAGMLSKGDSVTLTHAEFSSKQNCEAAGEQAVKTFSTMMKDSKYICVMK